MNFIPRAVQSKRKKDQASSKFQGDSRAKQHKQTNSRVKESSDSESGTHKLSNHLVSNVTCKIKVSPEIVRETTRPNDEVIRKSETLKNQNQKRCFREEKELSSSSLNRDFGEAKELSSSSLNRDFREAKELSSSTLNIDLGTDHHLNVTKSESAILDAIENQKDPPYRDVGCLSPRKVVAVYKRPVKIKSYNMNKPHFHNRHIATGQYYSNVSWTPQYDYRVPGSRENPIDIDTYSNTCSVSRTENRNIQQRSRESNRHIPYSSQHDHRRSQTFSEARSEAYRFRQHSGTYEPSQQSGTHKPSQHTGTNRFSQQHSETNRFSQHTGHKEPSFGHPREWEYTSFGTRYLNSPRYSGELDFTVMSYNVLAQNLLEDNQYNLYQHCKPHILDWECRKHRLLREFIAHSPDIICLQEVNSTHFEDFFSPELENLGYKGEYIKRTNDKLDGCASFYKTSKFTLEEAIPIHYNNPKGGEVLDRDNVALILKLIPKRIQSNSYKHPKRLCVSNTHLLFNPRRGDVKLAQLMMLLAELDKCGHLNTVAGTDLYHGLIMCGDFNMEPMSDIYKFMTLGYLYYEGLSRRHLSGQVFDNHYAGPFLDKQLMPSSIGISDNCQYCDKVNERNKHSYYNEDAFDDVTETNKQGSGLLSHQLKLLSVYTHRVERLGYKDEEVTTHHGQASCTVDFIFYGIDSGEVALKRNKVCVRNVKLGSLRLVGRYGLLSERELVEMGSLPNERFGSDHLCLISRFVWSER